MILLTEKYKEYYFPEHKDEENIFTNGNKCILLRQTKNSRINRLRVGYICLSKRIVPLKLQKESSEDFFTFKEMFYVNSNVLRKDGSPITFGLYSMSSKKRIDFEYFCFGFVYDFDKQYLVEDELSPKIEIEKFWDMLKKMEAKILNYGKN